MKEPYKAWALMTETAVHLQPAFILQQRKYRETSLIIDVLTLDFGRISVLAKGVRTCKSKTAGLLQPFIPLVLSYFGKAELKILTDVERSVCFQKASGLTSVSEEQGQSFSELKGLALYCGFYLNELITLFLHKYDPHPEVYGYYRDCLFSLSTGCSLEADLRLFELKLLECAGYGLQLDYDCYDKPVEATKKYQYNLGHGAIEVVNGPFSGQTLLALSTLELSDAEVLREAKILMRRVIDVYLQGKPLKSRAVINKMMITIRGVDNQP